MIRNSKQVWQPGELVRVGFLRDLRVVEAIATPRNYAPDQYVLYRAGVWYRFVPHRGIERMDSRESARETF